MKPSRRNPLLRSFVLTAISLILGQSAHSAALTWAGGAGIWETGVQGGWDATWNANDTGTFNGTGGIVTVQSAITTGNAELAFTSGDYSLSAASPFGITLGNNNVRVTPGLTTTIGQNVTLSRAAGLSFLGGGTVRIGAGGTLTQTTANASEVAASTTLHIDGGTANFATSLVIGRFNGTSGVSGTLLVDSGTLALSAGNINLGRSNGDVSIGTINNGSITVTAGNLNFGATATSTSTFNLNGGTLSVRAVTDANTTSKFNFNGGTLKASAGATSPFMAGLDTVQIRNGAAIIDTSGLNIAISQSIAHSAELGDNAIDGGLTKIGSGVLTLSGTNTYTGATSINEGVLSISSTAALPGWNTNSSYSVANGATLAVTNTVDDATVATLLGTTNFAAGAAIGFDTAAGNRTYSATIANTSQGALGVTKAGGNSLILNAANTYSGTTSVLSGELLIQNSSSLGTTAAGTAVTTGARLVLAGGITVSDEPLTLSGNGTDFFGALRSSSGVNQWTGPITIAANDTRIGASAGSTMEVSGLISSGSNTHLVTFRPVDTTASVIVSGANTYVGPTTLTGGLVTASSLNSVVGGTASSNFGAPTTALTGIINFGAANGSGLKYIGSGETTDRVINLAGTTHGGIIDQSGMGLLKFTSAFTATGGGSKSLTLQGSTAGTGEIGAALVDNSGTNKTSLIKAGTGTWTLSGTNSFTGATSVNAGTLKLDYASGNDSTKLADAAALTLGSATLELTGGTHTETVASTNLTAGTASKVTRSSGNAVLQMNAITRNAGASIDFGASGIATTDTTNTNGIIGTWATVNGADWAANATNGADGQVIAYTGYSDLDTNDVIADGATSHVRIASTGGLGNMTLGSPITTIATLLQGNPGQAAVIDLQSTNTLQTSAIMVGTSAMGLTIGTSSGDGFLTAATAGGDILLRNNSLSELLTINSNIINNTSATSVTKVGQGVVVLAGANTYTGATNLAEGTLRAGSSDAFGGSGPLVMTGSSQFDLAGFDAGFTNLSAAAATTITTTGPGSGVDTLTVSALTGPIDALISDNGTRQLAVSVAGNSGSPLSNLGNTFSGGLAIGSLTRITVVNGTVGTPGSIVNGPFGRGPITVNGGNVFDQGAQIWFSASNRSLINDIIVNGNGGMGSRGGTFRIGTNGAAVTGLVISGNIDANDADAAFGSDSTSDGSALLLSGQLTGNSGFRFFISANSSKWTTTLLNATANPNDYAGPTTIANTATTVRLGASDQIPNGIGKSDVTVNLGTLDLNGFNETINGLAGTGIIDNVASGTTNTLTFGDEDTTGLAFSGTIRNTTGTLSLVKIGEGTQTLSGPNIYSGTTTVSGGTLLINGNQNGATGAVQVDSGTLGGTGSIGGAVTVASGGTIAPGTDGSIESLDIAANTSIAGTFACDVDGATTDLLNVTGDLTLGGTLAINEIASGTPGTYVIATYTGTRSGTLGGTLPSGYTVNYDDANKQVELVISSGNPYDTWGLPYGLASGSEGADLDNDGLTNFEEFAFGLLPNSGSSVNPITAPLSKTTGEFTYQRLAASGLTYTIWTSENLSSWTLDAGAVQTPTTVGDNESVQVTLSATPKPLTASKLFIRVMAE